MSSSRSITGARARRAGDPQQQQRPQQPGGGGGRPIGFPPQQQQQQQQFMGGRQNGFPPQQQQQQYQQQQQQYQQQQQQQQRPQQQRPQQQQQPPQQMLGPNGLPPTISIQDAFSLVTMRLSKVERFLNDLQHAEQEANDEMGVPIDNSGIIERIISLEKTISAPLPLTISDKKFIELKNVVVKMQQEVKKINIKMDEIEEMHTNFEENINSKINDFINSSIPTNAFYEFDKEAVEEEEEEEKIEELEFDYSDELINPNSKNNINNDLYVSDEETEDQNLELTI
jgi:hypothetical protein